jgi:hypothetical protein
VNSSPNITPRGVSYVGIALVNLHHCVHGQDIFNLQNRGPKNRLGSVCISSPKGVFRIIF